LIYIITSISDEHLLIFHPRLVLFEQLNCIDWIYFVIYGHWPIYSFFLVPASYWAILKHGNSLSANFLDELERRLFLHFVKTICYFFLFFFLLCRINTIHVYVHCRKIYNSFSLAEKEGRKALKWLICLPVSKARTNTFYTLRQCTYNYRADIRMWAVLLSGW
jgi:hypothetical protein